jgi:hypothetical protein
VFILAHIGIGRTIARPWSRRLPVIAFVVGALLPDAIDKPLFYLHLSPYITATRTVAHSGLFLVIVLAIALLRRSRAWLAVVVGMATHLALDCLMDSISTEPHSAIVALGWPFLTRQFVNYPFRSPVEHLEHLWNIHVLVTELIGLVLIVWEVRASLQKGRHEGQATRFRPTPN